MQKTQMKDEKILRTTENRLETALNIIRSDHPYVKVIRMPLTAHSNAFFGHANKNLETNWITLEKQAIHNIHQRNDSVRMQDGTMLLCPLTNATAGQLATDLRRPKTCK